MKFKSSAFTSQAFTARQESVPVPELADWFELEKGETPTWTVRGLTGAEIVKTQESDKSAAQAARIVAAIANSSAKGKADSVLEMMGLDAETPAELAKRIDQLVIASVEPTCDRHTAVTLFERFPVIGLNLTNTILKLTGLGAQPGKRKASTVETK